MTLSFFSFSRSALLCSIIILGSFFLFGQIGVTHAATLVPPTLTSPASSWTFPVQSGNTTFQWSYSGDPTNVWYYFYLLHWDLTQNKWVVIASEYTQTNSNNLYMQINLRLKMRIQLLRITILLPIQNL
jgi:hypothetical protein